VKSWLNVYFQEVHQAIVQNEWVRNVGKLNLKYSHGEGEELTKSLSFHEVHQSDGPKKRD
jgi:hypothetical protein